MLPWATSKFLALASTLLKPLFALPLPRRVLFFAVALAEQYIAHVCAGYWKESMMESVTGTNTFTP